MALRIMRLLVLTAAGLAISGLILLLAMRFHPATLGILLAAAGQRDTCGLPEAIAGIAKKSEVLESQPRIAGALRALRSDPNGLTLWETPHGKFWAPSDSGSVMPVLLAQQQARIYGEVAAGEIVIDGGAHVGVYTRRAIDAGAKLVVAVEPAPENVECLRRNFANEIGAGRVIVYPKGVWHRDDELVLHTVAGNSAGDSFVIKNGEGKGVRVPLTTIDKLTAELNLPRVDRIKLDIKGAERQALRGAVEVLKRFRPKLALAAEHHPDDYAQLPALVRNLRPESNIHCGICFVRNYRVYPETLLIE